MTKPDSEFSADLKNNAQGAKDSGHNDANEFKGVDIKTVCMVYYEKCKDKITEVDMGNYKMDLASRGFFGHMNLIPNIFNTRGNNINIPIDFTY